MTTLFLVRHGLTEHTGKTLYGRTRGISLDDRGRAQARHLAERLAPVRPTAIYSSPLERCIQTVEPLAASCRLPIRERDGLIEMHAGSWTGKPRLACVGRRLGVRCSGLRQPSDSRAEVRGSPRPGIGRWRRSMPSLAGTVAGAWSSPRTATSSA